MSVRGWRRTVQDGPGSREASARQVQPKAAGARGWASLTGLQNQPVQTGAVRSSGQRMRTIPGISWISLLICRSQSDPDGVWLWEWMLTCRNRQMPAVPSQPV